jgi:hypothetical protein
MDPEKCIDRDIGAMLPAYESSLLGSDDQAAFESHVANCPFCRSRLHQMSPFVTAVQSEPGSMSPGVTGMPSQKSFERSILSGAFDAGVGGGEAGRPRFTSGKIWKTYVPLTVIVLITLMVLVLQGRTPPSADFVRLQQPEAGFLESIPVDAVGRAHLVSGLELFYADQYNEAIGELRSSLPSPNRSIRSCSRWYLAQSYLIADDVDTAALHLRQISEVPSAYQQAAADQLRKLRRERLLQ